MALQWKEQELWKMTIVQNIHKKKSPSKINLELIPTVSAWQRKNSIVSDQRINSGGITIMKRGSGST